jgi:hypothetical protein
MNKPIKKKEREAILQSLRAGVVPGIGLHHIQVGRKDEVEAILKDLESIKNGGATVRFMIGKYGTGKSFFLNLSRIVALQKQFVVVHADITPDRRLHASGGQARLLFSEMMKNMSTKAKPTGGALAGIVEKWVSDINFEVQGTGAGKKQVEERIVELLRPLQDYVSGYDFCQVIIQYVNGFENHQDKLMDSAVRWLHAEYGTKTEARQDLGVRSIIDDQNIYDYLKLFAAFVRLSGYSGLIVNLDEMGVLSHRLNNSQARNANYEVILRILNDCLQGNVVGLGFIFSGTDKFLDDQRRGLNSYEALASRLANNTFEVGGLRDFSGPVIRLENLSPEDLFVLLHKIRHVFANGDKEQYLIDEAGMKAFMAHCSNQLGAEFFKTPREIVKSYIGFLSILEQNPKETWQSLLSKVQVDSPFVSYDDKDNSVDSGDSLASFKL